MLHKGTTLRYFKPALPLTSRDTPTQPGLRRPTPFAILLARAQLFPANPLDRLAMLGVVLIWILVMLVSGLASGILAYDVLAKNTTLSPERQAILDPRAFRPLVHIGFEPLRTPAAPAAPTRRPPLILPTPSK
jgi:hypothetical protein